MADGMRWLCPCCRTICNCSGAACQRACNGWQATGRLDSEAKSMLPKHYGSVSAVWEVELTLLTQYSCMFPKAPIDGYDVRIPCHPAIHPSVCTPSIHA
eukprot:365595-Chlamydomonas_euryale.AAC.16